MRRLASLLFALLLASGILFAAPASAAVDDYHWDSAFGGYVDRACDVAHAFKVDVFDDANYQGGRARICSAEPSFCYVPMFQGHGANCWGTGMINDRITSYKVREVPSCRYVTFNWDVNYSGPYWNASGSSANIGSTHNDQWSSVRLTAWC